MADKIVDLNAQEAQSITEAWVASYPNFVDAHRNIDTLRFHLFNNVGAHWYKGITDNSYFLVTNVVRGHQALHLRIGVL
jgi:hypothetical protein